MSRYRNLALFLVIAAVWGSAFTAIKAGLAFFPPVLFAAVRYGVAGVLMLAYAWVVTDRPIPRTRQDWPLVGIGRCSSSLAITSSSLWVNSTRQAQQRPSSSAPVPS